VAVLVVQMGHAGRTSGATGAPGEQAYTQAVGAACARLLGGRDGWSVRPVVADPPVAQYRGDAFVAIHADGSTNPAVRGASVGWQNGAGAGFAHNWRDAYIRRGFTGPWHPDNYTANLGQYYGVRAAIGQGNARAFIAECGTITNAEDRALMAPDRVALAIGDALGIHTEEDDVTAWNELLDYSLTGGTPSTAFYRINNGFDGLAANAAASKAMLATVIANQQDDLSADDVVEHLSQTFRDLMSEAVVPAIRSAVAEAVRETEGATPEEIADAVADKVAQRLAT
jgi:hypothetical protein